MTGFRHLRDQVFRLYQRGAFAEALELVTAALPVHPGEVDDLQFWRACLACRAGRPDLALAALQEAAAAGAFYSEPFLRDPDLDLIRSHPEFQRLLALFRERLDAAGSPAPPAVWTQTPAGPGPWPLLLVLHGNGSRPELECGHWEAAVAEGWLLAMPRARQRVTRTRFSWGNLDQVARDVREHVEGLRERQPLASGIAVLGGFSLGGGLAMALALTGAVPAQGFIAVAPSLPAPLASALAGSAGPQPVRGYVVAGGQDPVSGPARELGAALRQQGLPCAVDVRPHLGHEYPEDFAAALTRFLATVAAAA